MVDGVRAARDHDGVVLHQLLDTGNLFVENLEGSPSVAGLVENSAEKTVYIDLSLGLVSVGDRGTQVDYRYAASIFLRLQLPLNVEVFGHHLLDVIRLTDAFDLREVARLEDV